VNSLQAGLWVPPGAPFCGQTAGGLASTRAYFVRFACPKSQAVTKISFFVTTAASVDDPCDVGIYDSAATPNRLGSSGSTSGLLNSTGLKQAALTAPVALVQGQIYYAALACGTVGGTAAQLQLTTVLGSMPILFGSAAGQIEQYANTPGFPLAATASAPVMLNNAPILALLQ